MPFSRPTIVISDGARVTTVSCLACGAAIMLDPRVGPDAAALHEQWHRQVALPTTTPTHQLGELWRS